MKIEYIQTNEDDKWAYGNRFVDGEFTCRWMKLKNCDLWFTHDFETILYNDLGLNLNQENIKQLKDLYEGDLDALYKIYTICKDEPSQDLAIQTHLMNRTMSTYHIHSFLAECRKHKITGSRFKQLLKEYTTHFDLTKMDFSTTETIQFDVLIEKVWSENQEKISKSDKNKITNYLVGQIMKQIEDKKNVNIEEIRKKINERF